MLGVDLIPQLLELGAREVGVERVLTNLGLVAVADVVVERMLVVDALHQRLNILAIGIEMLGQVVVSNGREARFLELLRRHALAIDEATLYEREVDIVRVFLRERMGLFLVRLNDKALEELLRNGLGAFAPQGILDVLL